MFVHAFIVPDIDPSEKLMDVWNFALDEMYQWQWAQTPPLKGCALAYAGKTKNAAGLYDYEFEVYQMTNE